MRRATAGMQIGLTVLLVVGETVDTRAQTGSAASDSTLSVRDTVTFADSGMIIDRSPAIDAARARIPRLERAAGIDERRWPHPTTTLLKSMVVPGWGQITNRRYTKAAVVIGLETWFLVGTVVNWRRANDAADRFRSHSDPFDEEARQDFLEYQFYWGNRGDYLWALGLTVFISMFDAYVDAHLRPYEGDTIPGVEPPRGLELVLDL